MKTYVSILILDRQFRYLLQKREENKKTYYPGHWGIFGGRVERGEEISKAAFREIKEELNYSVRRLKYITRYTSAERTDILFAEFTFVSLDNLKLTEGNDMRFFSYGEILKLEKIVPLDRTMISDFHSSFLPEIKNFFSTS